MRISDWSSDVCSSDLSKERAAIASARPRDSKGFSAVSEPVNLSDDEFTEARPSASRGSGNGANSLAGTYSDSIREFLNLLTGRGERGADADDDDGWLDMSDETDGSSDADVEPDTTEASERKPVEPRTVDAKEFEEFIWEYAEEIERSEEQHV